MAKDVMVSAIFFFAAQAWAYTTNVNRNFLTNFSWKDPIESLQKWRTKIPILQDYELRHK